MTISNIRFGTPSFETGAGSDSMVAAVAGLGTINPGEILGFVAYATNDTASPQLPATFSELYLDSSTRVLVGAKYAAGGDGDITIAFDATTAVKMVVAFAISGVKLSQSPLTGILDGAIGTGSGTGLLGNWPAKTGQAASSAVLVGFFKSNNQTTMTGYPSGYTPHVDAESGLGSDCSVWLGSKLNAGDLSSGTFTFGGTDESGVWLSFAMAFLEEPASAATFDGTPTASEITGGIEVDFEITGGNATVSAVAVQRNSGAPSSAQIHAGQNSAGAAAFAADAVSAIADTPDTLTLDGFALGDRQIFDVYVAVGTNVEALVDETRGAGADEQFWVAPTGPYETGSLGEAAGTAEGDIFSAPLVWSPDGTQDLLLDAEGRPSSDDPQEGWQYFSYWRYDFSSDGFDTGGFNVNNGGPIENTPLPTFNWYAGIAITPVVLNNHFTDPEGQPIDFSGLAASLPSGVTIEDYDVGQVGQYSRIEGTPAAAGAGSISGSIFDHLGQELVITSASWNVDDEVATVPDLDDGDVLYTDGQDTLVSLNLDYSITRVLDGGVTVANIVSQSVAPGTVVPWGTSIGLTVSAAEMPDLTGEDPDTSAPYLIAAAIEDAEALGLMVDPPGGIGVHSSSVPAGQVTTQEIEMDELVLPGDRLTLTYSLGPREHRSGRVGINIGL